MSRRDPGYRLTFVWLALWAGGFGVLALFFPGLAAGALGVTTGDNGFLVSLFGSFLIPWGAGLLLAARSSRRTRGWAALALVQSLTGAVVTTFFLGRGVLDTGNAIVFFAVFAVGAAGILVFGHEEVWGRSSGSENVVFGRDPNAGSERSYTVSVEDEEGN
jgi:hypothetical protein